MEFKIPSFEITSDNQTIIIAIVSAFVFLGLSSLGLSAIKKNYTSLDSASKTVRKK